MSFWIELHCDSKSGLTSTDKFGQLTCYSTQGIFPGTHANLHLSKVKSRLIENAVSRGWVKTEDGMICPACAKSENR